MDETPGCEFQETDARRAARALRDAYGAAAKEIIVDLLESCDDTDTDVVAILEHVKACL